MTESCVEVKINSELTKNLGFLKVSDMKSFITREIENYVLWGGFLFAMYTATDTYDISLAATGIDICEHMFDGDPTDKQANEELDFTNFCF